MPAARSKIEKLSFNLRESLHNNLLDGMTPSEAIGWLNDRPDVQKRVGKISPQNFSEWQAKYHEEWMAKRETVENTRSLAEFSMRLAKASGGNVGEGAVAIAAGKILEMIEGAEGETREKLIQSLTSLRGTEIATKKLAQEAVKLEQKDRQLALEEKRFQRQTAELFIEYVRDVRAREIADGKGTTDFKVSKLIPILFGKRPNEPQSAQRLQR